MSKATEVVSFLNSSDESILSKFTPKVEVDKLKSIFKWSNDQIKKAEQGIKNILNSDLGDNVLEWGVTRLGNIYAAMFIIDIKTPSNTMLNSRDAEKYIKASKGIFDIYLSKQGSVPKEVNLILRVN